MASSAVSADQSSIEVFPWLKTLPLAPEYRPTLAEFQDPIGYIFKIEKEASRYGICKIVPPVSPQSKKTSIANLNRSLAARSSSSDPKSPPTFTTRQQQIGFCPRKHRPVQKPVWQSGEHYTLPQFEAKAKSFERNYSRKSSKKSLSALEVETLYWKASRDKPFSVEYANDMPGSGFVPVSSKKSSREVAGESMSVGETAWNMRGVSRAKGSLLRFMKEEIPGVTSPMVYIAMMFSWFAWHVEDHDLHSLNYLHMGAGKTWYGVPREAAVAFEEVIRVHGYGGEINPLVMFAILGEKTTVMSPEVLNSAGVPCCRLVQNAGEFVVTFPRAYHCGFSHGFNIGEATNIATPEWLRVAKDAAIRRASINCPPMVSHFQLLYDLALSLCSRVSMSISAEPRSSRLKDKKKGEGETLIKELFVQDMMQNNDLLHILGNGSSIVIIPENTLLDSVCSNFRGGSKCRIKSRLSLGSCSLDKNIRPSGSFSDDSLLNRRHGLQQMTGFHMMKGKFSFCDGKRLPLLSGNDYGSTLTTSSVNEGENTAQADRLSDKGLFTCVTCGIVSFACIAVVQPKEAAAHYLMSADCSLFNDQDVDSRGISDAFANASELNSCSGRMVQSTLDGLFDVPIRSADNFQRGDQSMDTDNFHRSMDMAASKTDAENNSSALGLLALTYGNSSDSEDDQVEADLSVDAKETRFGDSSPENSSPCANTGSDFLPFSRDEFENDVPLEITDSYAAHRGARSRFRNRTDQTFDCTVEFDTNNIFSKESNTFGGRFEHQMRSPPSASNYSLFAQKAGTANGKGMMPIETTNTLSFAPSSDEDSSRMHVFCLQHAAEVEQQLRPYGGAHIFLFCHPDYPELEAEAKLVAEELGIEYLWNDVSFKEATKEDEESLKSVLISEEAIHGNGDWTVKLGFNLYYSASLSSSPLYSKQMPYNSVIYSAFGRCSRGNSPVKPKVYERRSRQKKIVLAGKWCGKVWMSNQVHPLLAERDTEDQEEERGFNSLVKPVVKPEILPEDTHTPETASASSRTGRKRKMTCESGVVTKAKCSRIACPVKPLEDSPEEEPSQQCRRNLRNKQIKQVTPRSQSVRGRNSRQMDSSCTDDELEGGPSTRLRKRISKPSKVAEAKPIDTKVAIKKKRSSKRAFPVKATSVSRRNTKIIDEEGDYQCDMEGCTMSFGSKQELALHMRNICPIKDCGKKFFSHKYLVQHRRVHMDDRPLKCPWKGCKMTFKWAWARTEHIRVHTGARPYVCNETGCGQTFRFVSDFSRHKRKTGHSAKRSRG